MSLTEEQQQLIAEIDREMKMLLKQKSSEEKVLVEMLPFMPKIKALMDSVPKTEIEMYFNQYDGFYHYMKMIESLAKRIQSGKFSIP